MSHLRAERLAALMKEEISGIIRRELKDPRIGFATVTGVEVSVDLRHVRVFVSVYGTEEEKRQTLRGLESATGFIRNEMGKRIRLRYTPEILFSLDSSIERGARVFELLHLVNKEDRKSSDEGGGQTQDG